MRQLAISNRGADGETEKQAETGTHQADQIDPQQQPQQGQNLQSIGLHQPAAVFHGCQRAVAVMHEQGQC